MASQASNSAEQHRLFNGVEGHLSSIQWRFQHHFCTSLLSPAYWQAIQNKRSGGEKEAIKIDGEKIGALLQKWNSVVRSAPLEDIKFELVGDFFLELEQEIRELASRHFSRTFDNTCIEDCKLRLTAVQRNITMLLANLLCARKIDPATSAVNNEKSLEFFQEGVKLQGKAAGSKNESDSLLCSVQAAVYFARALNCGNDEAKIKLNQIVETIHALIHRHGSFLLGKLMHRGSINAAHPLFNQVFDFLAFVSKEYTGPVPEKVSNLFTHLEQFPPDSVEAANFVQRSVELIQSARFKKDPDCEDAQEQQEYQEHVLEKLDNRFQRAFAKQKLVKEYPEALTETKTLLKDPIIRLFKSDFQRSIQVHTTLEVDVALVLAEVREKFIEIAVKGRHRCESEDVIDLQMKYLEDKFAKKLDLVQHVETIDSEKVEPCWKNLTFEAFVAAIKYGDKTGKMGHGLYDTEYSFSQTTIKLFLSLINEEAKAPLIYHKIKERLLEQCPNEAESILRSYYETQDPPRLNVFGAKALLFSLGYLSEYKKPARIKGK